MIFVVQVDDLPRDAALSDVVVPGLLTAVRPSHAFDGTGLIVATSARMSDAFVTTDTSRCLELISD